MGFPVNDTVSQGCQTRGLLRAALHVGNRDEGHIMFIDLEITTSSSRVFVMWPAARLMFKNKNKKVITSPASPHHRISSGIVNQKLSSAALDF